MPADDNAGFDAQLPDLSGFPLELLADHPVLRRAAERLAEREPDVPVAAFQAAL